MKKTKMYYFDADFWGDSSHGLGALVAALVCWRIVFYNQSLKMFCAKLEIKNIISAHAITTSKFIKGLVQLKLTQTHFFADL